MLSMKILVVLIVVGAAVRADEQLHDWSIMIEYQDTAGRELFGKRSSGSSVNEEETLDTMPSVDGWGSSSDFSYATPSEQQRPLFVFASDVADEVHTSEVDPTRMSTMQLLNVPLGSESEFILQRPCGLSLRQRRAKSRELLG
ncbi:unnamed protein product [Toxocara canis]|uniref:Secreted protein n=1 Tax=Toxocara canis TaxID=6265 RepID=A0A183U5J2_TOXCA|nr:unnamed protein product [Toxocara canis]